MFTAPQLRPLRLTLTLLLAAAAAPAAAQPTPRTTELQSLVERAARHLSLRRESLRGNYTEHQSRRDALQQTLTAWNNSARTDQDADAMEAWLRAVINASMLGGRGPMPAPPVFQTPEEVARARQPRPEVVPAEPASPIAFDPAPSSVDEVPFEPDPFDPVEAPVEATEQPQVTRQPPVRRPAAPAPAKEAPPVSEWANHPSAPELDWSDPFADDAPARGSAGIASTRFKPVSRSRTVKVDLLELSSRVAGYNSRLRELEGLLIGSDELSAFRLAAIVRDLDELNDQRGFLQLYLAGLSPEEAEVGPQLNSSDSLVKLVGKAVSRRGESINAQLGSRAEAESAILSALYRKLDEMGDN